MKSVSEFSAEFCTEFCKAWVERTADIRFGVAAFYPPGTDVDAVRRAEHELWLEGARRWQLYFNQVDSGASAGSAY